MFFYKFYKSKILIFILASFGFGLNSQNQITNSNLEESSRFEKDGYKSTISTNNFFTKTVYSPNSPNSPKKTNLNNGPSQKPKDIITEIRTTSGELIVRMNGPFVEAAESEYQQKLQQTLFDDIKAAIKTEYDKQQSYSKKNEKVAAKQKVIELGGLFREAFPTQRLGAKTLTIGGISAVQTSKKTTAPSSDEESEGLKIDDINNFTMESYDQKSQVDDPEEEDSFQKFLKSLDDEIDAEKLETQSESPKEKLEETLKKIQTIFDKVDAQDEEERNNPESSTNPASTTPKPIISKATLPIRRRPKNEKKSSQAINATVAETQDGAAKKQRKIRMKGILGV